jgi:hypothetical protein
VSSTTILYDKRREPCYANIPVVSYMHVSSAVHARIGGNILYGQLHRFTSIILDRTNFVLEVARCVRSMHDRGFKLDKLLWIVKRFLRRKWYQYHDQNYRSLYGDIVSDTLLRR